MSSAASRMGSRAVKSCKQHTTTPSAIACDQSSAETETGAVCRRRTMDHGREYSGGGPWIGLLTSNIQGNTLSPVNMTGRPASVALMASKASTNSSSCRTLWAAHLDAWPCSHHVSHGNSMFLCCPTVCASLPSECRRWFAEPPVMCED